MKNTGSKSSRSRPGGTDRGGIRKRGPTRIDRDGDMDMDAAGGGRNRGGKRARGGDSGRSTAAAGRTPAMDVIQKALSDNTASSQATVRQGRKGGGGSNLEQVCVRGWKQSKAASNRDGGLESLITFLEKKLNAPDSKSSSRARITKVCVHNTLKQRKHQHFGGYRHLFATFRSLLPSLPKLSLAGCVRSSFPRMASYRNDESTLLGIPPRLSSYCFLLSLFLRCALSFFQGPLLPC